MLTANSACRIGRFGSLPKDKQIQALKVSSVYTGVIYRPALKLTFEAAVITPRSSSSRYSGDVNEKLDADGSAQLFIVAAQLKQDSCSRPHTLIPHVVCVCW